MRSGFNTPTTSGAGTTRPSNCVTTFAQPYTAPLTARTISAVHTVGPWTPRRGRLLTPTMRAADGPNY